MLFHVILQTHDIAPVSDEHDWRVLGEVVADMQFWCGGHVFACRAEGNFLRLALQTARTTVDAMCSRIMIALARHLQNRHGVAGEVFRHYRAIPVDMRKNRLNLVLWLHRNECDAWTTHGAYLQPQSLTWVDANIILAEFPVPAEMARDVYVRWCHRGVSPEIVAEINPPAGARRLRPIPVPAPPIDPPRISGGLRQRNSHKVREIVRLVAPILDIPAGELYGDSRKRPAARARYVIAVICVRQGVSLATTSRVLKRQLSTLEEGARRLRKQKPEIFDHIERQVAHQLER